MTASITIHLYAFPSGCTTTARHLKQCDGLVSSSEIVLIMDQNKATPVEHTICKKKTGAAERGQSSRFPRPPPKAPRRGFPHRSRGGCCDALEDLGRVIGAKTGCC